MYNINPRLTSFSLSSEILYSLPHLQSFATIILHFSYYFNSEILRLHFVPQSGFVHAKFVQILNCLGEKKSTHI